MSDLINNYKTYKDLGRIDPANDIVDNGDGSFTLSMILKDPHTGLDNGTEAVTYTVDNLNDTTTAKNSKITELQNHVTVQIPELITDTQNL